MVDLLKYICISEEIIKVLEEEITVAIEEVVEMTGVSADTFEDEIENATENAIQTIVKKVLSELK